MAKRSASNYLTDQNFEQEEEEPEEAGSFKAASPDIVKNRQIKIARRRGAAGNGDDTEGTSGAFKGFAGFTSTSKPASASSAVSFSFASSESAMKLTTASASFNFSTSVTSMASSSTDSNIASSSASLLKPPVSTAPVDSTGFRFGTGQTVTSLTKTSDETTKSSGTGGIRFDFFKSSNSASAAAKPSTVGNGLTSSPAAASSATGSSGTAQYRQQLKALNETVLKWIDQHVRSNPDCILTPVFDDYNRYIAELERKFPRTTTTSTTSADKPILAGEVAMVVSSCALATAGPAESIPAVSTSTDKEKTGTLAATTSKTTTAGTAAVVTTAATLTTAAAMTTAASFSFGLASSSTSVPKSTAPTTTTTATSAPFSFGSGSTFSVPAFASGGFSAPAFGSGTAGLFGSKSGFSFGSTAAATADSDTQQSTASTTAGDDDEEYVPPKPEVVEIKEDDAFYTIKCKLFYMLSGAWKERGVGNLYLKPTAGGKTQLLVRADNNLGTILLNILLSKSIPTDLQSKNTVSLSCIPNPPVDANKPDQNPICMLIRVKTTENATELLKQLNDNKK